MMDARLFYLSLILAFALAMFGNYLLSIFGIVLVADKVRKCPCCNQPINSIDYGKKVWEGDNATE